MNLKSLASRLLGRAGPPPPARTATPFTTSGDYWERRYQEGGNSGAGSYDRLARFKAEIVNEFVARNDVASVVEFGTGDGAQLELACYPRYVGVDVAPTIVALLKNKFAGDATKSFQTLDEFDIGLERFDLSLSLDVIYHLVEDDVFGAYMATLFDASSRFVIIYASDKDQPGARKHVRHRKFSEWVERHRPDFSLLRHVPNRYPFDPADRHNTSFADFRIYRRRD